MADGEIVDRRSETAALPFASLSERALSPISTVELERRWAAVRSAMEDHSVDVLIVQNNNDHMGGYVRYLCDMAAVNGGAVTVVFPRRRYDVDHEWAVRRGSATAERGDGFLRGVGRVLTAPSFRVGLVLALLRGRARCARTGAVRQGVDRAGVHISDVAGDGRVFRSRGGQRRLERGVGADRPCQSNQIDRGAGPAQTNRRAPGCGDRGCVCGRGAREARQRDCGGGSARRPRPRRGAGDLLVCICTTSAGDDRPAAVAGPDDAGGGRLRAAGRDERSRWPLRGDRADVCAWDRARGTVSRSSSSRCWRGVTVLDCSSPELNAVRSGRSTTLSCEHTGGRRNAVSTVIAKAMTWSNDRWFGSMRRSRWRET